MQITKKSKIFSVLLFLAALLFVSCSFEDTLGTSVRNTTDNAGNVETGGDSSSGENGNSGNGTSGGDSSGGNSGSGGTSGGGGSGSGSIKNDGSYIPKIYHGKYTEVGSRDISYITIGNDNKGDYIMQEGGNKEYVKDLVYSAENTWKQVEPAYGYYSTTWQYTLKTINNRRIFYFTYIRTYIPKNHSSTNYETFYRHNEDR